MRAPSRPTAAALFLVGAFVLQLGPASARQGQGAADKPEPRADAGWKKLHESFVATAKKGGVDVLFVGDSITRGWDGAGKDVWKKRFAAWKPANFGIGGDRTQHVLWRITAGKELDGIDPKVIVLMIGTNNFAANTPDEIAAGVKAIVGEFRKQEPNAKVLLLGVFPRSAKPGRELKGVDAVPAAELHPKAKQVNERIAKLDDGKHVKYLDIGATFLDEQGGLSKAVMPDFLHLSAKGYELWADAIDKAVGDLLK